MSESNIKNIKFHSDILDKEMGINVYLPKEYKENGNPLPVLYFLHGRSGNESIMYDLNINVKADEMIEKVFEKRYDLTKQDKREILDEVSRNFDIKDKPIFELVDKINKELKVYLYPTLKDDGNGNAYLSYNIIVKNNQYQLKYTDTSMMIGYLTNPGEENRIKQYMYEMGKEFEKDIADFMIDAENLADLQWKAKDNYFYENYRSPLIAIRENGNILEITKEKGKIIASIYASNNNIDKCELISKRLLSDNFNLDNMKSLEEVKNNCYRLIVEGLEEGINVFEEETAL